MATDDLRDRPVGELLRELSTQTSTLVRQELELAKAEMGEKAKRAGLGAGAVAALHWFFALFHTGLAVLFLHLASWAKPLVVVPALMVQLLWLAFVGRLVRRAGLSWRSDAV